MKEWTLRVRFPLEHNEKGYKFGHELEVHFGVLYPLPALDAVQLIAGTHCR